MAGESLLPEALHKIADNTHAATIASCLLLKVFFLALHLLALNLPECTGLEKLALLHWSFDIWNVWCLAVFVRSGQMPWSLETCVVYHVLGYMVFTVVFLHLQTRQWPEDGGGLSRMSRTPDSEITVRVSEEEEDVMMAAGSHPFPMTEDEDAGVLSEDVPDEEAAVEDGVEDRAEDKDGARTGAERAATERPLTAEGRDALCSAPGDTPALTNGHPTPPPPLTSPEDQTERTEDQTERSEDQRGLKEDQGSLTADQGEPRKDSSPERRQPETISPRPYRKLDAAGDLLQKSPTEKDAERRLDITEDVAAALKAGRQRDISGDAQDADITGVNKYSPVKTNLSPDPQKVVIVKVDLDAGSEQSGGADQVPQLEDAKKSDGKSQNGDHNGVQNGDHNGVQNGDHNGVQNGDHNGDHNGTQNGDHNGTQNGDHNGAQNGDHNGQQGEGHKDA